MCDASFFSFVPLLSAAFFFFCLFVFSAGLPRPSGIHRKRLKPPTRGAILHPRRPLPARMVDGTARGTWTSGRLRSLSSALRSLVWQSLYFTVSRTWPRAGVRALQYLRRPDQGAPLQIRAAPAGHDEGAQIIPSRLATTTGVPPRSHRRRG